MKKLRIFLIKHRILCLNNLSNLQDNISRELFYTGNVETIYISSLKIKLAVYGLLFQIFDSFLPKKWKF